MARHSAGALMVDKTFTYGSSFLYAISGAECILALSEHNSQLFTEVDMNSCGFLQRGKYLF